MTKPADTRIRRVVAAPDKFRGTATAPEVADAIAAAVGDVTDGSGLPTGGEPCRRVPLADGGEGTVDAFGGPNRRTTVSGPLGAPIEAGWRLDGSRAVIEMSAASGLIVAGGASNNDPWAATTRGTGELILAAAEAGAREILVGVGGSATTDGGAGALEILAPNGGPSILSPSVAIRVCADVATRFLDAATVFGPQKGADRPLMDRLTERLAAQRTEYRRRFGIDVQALDRSGAAGGLAGGLAAIGAELVDGFATIADAVGLDEALRDADLVVTGEGRFDRTSLDGKVVGGVVDRAADRGVPVLVVCGQADPAVVAPAGSTVISLTDRFGAHSARTDTVARIRRAVADYLDPGAADAAAPHG